MAWPADPGTRSPAGAAAPWRLRRLARSDRTLLQSSTPTLVSRALARCGQFLFLLAAARILSVDEFAVYSYIVGLFATFSMLADTGVPTVASREVAAGREPTRTVFWSGLPAIGAGALVAACALATFGLVDSGPGSAGLLLALAAVYAAANTFFNYLSAILRGIGRFQLEAALQLGGVALAVGGGIAIIAAGGGITAVVGFFALKEVLHVAVLYLVMRREVKGPTRPLPLLLKRLFRAGVRLAVAALAFAVVTRLPQIVLGNTGSEEELAWFSAPARLADTIFGLAFVGSFALLPGLTYLQLSDHHRAVRLTGRLVGAAAVGGTVLGVASAALAPTIVRVLFGGRFEPASEPASVLLVGLPAYAVLGIAWHALIAFDRDRDVLPVGAIGVLSSIALSVLLIPSGGDVGAAWAYLLPSAAMSVTAAALLIRGITRRPTGGPLKN
jgi:O-antigen/teichoic acid export membrane protein